MPVLNTGSIVSVIQDGRIDGQQIMLTHHYTLTVVSGSAPDVTTAMNSLHAQLNATTELYETYANALSEDVVELQCFLQPIWPNRYIRHIFTPTNDHGLVEEAALPPNVAHTITIRALSAGPQYVGTKHIGGVPLSWSENGLRAAISTVPYQNLGFNLKKAYSTGAGGGVQTWDPIIYHRAAPGMSAVATNYILADTTRILRRRTVRVGS